MELTAPAPVTAARRTMVAVSLVAAAWSGLEVGWFVTGEVAEVPDHAARLHALARAEQPDGANGWDDLVEAGRRFSSAEDALRHESIARGLVDRPDVLRLLGPPTRTDDDACELQLFERMRSDGVDALVDTAASSPALLRTSIAFDDDSFGLAGVMLPNLGPFRHMAMAYLARMRLAFDQGDDTEMVRNFERALVHSRACHGQTFTIDHLVGLSINMRVLEELRFLLTEHAFSAETSASLLAAMDRQPSAISLALSIEGDRIVAKDVIARAFTDDRHGGGRLDFASFAGLSLFTGMAAPMPFGPSVFPLIPFHAGRRETLDAVDRFYEPIIAAARLSAAERGSLGTVSGLGGGAGFGSRFLLLQMLGPIARREQARFDTGRTFWEATRVMLAIEAFLAVHGEPPDDLEELVPAFLAATAVDPATGGAFGYAVVPDAARAGFQGRRYLLLSRGADAVLDVNLDQLVTGTMTGEFTLSEAVWDAGADVMINQVRPAP